MATWLEWINDKIRIPEDRRKEHFHLGPPKLDEQLIQDVSDWGQTVPKEWWQSYDDMEDPGKARGRDAFRLLANAGQDLAQFVGQTGVDAAQSV